MELLDTSDAQPLGENVLFNGRGIKPYLYTSRGQDADRIADFLETLAAHIRARETIVTPDRLFVAYMEGNSPEEGFDLEVNHIGLTKTMILRLQSRLRSIYWNR